MSSVAHAGGRGSRGSVSRTTVQTPTLASVCTWVSRGSTGAGAPSVPLCGPMKSTPGSRHHGADALERHVQLPGERGLDAVVDRRQSSTCMGTRRGARRPRPPPRLSWLRIETACEAAGKSARASLIRVVVNGMQIAISSTAATAVDRGPVATDRRAGELREHTTPDATQHARQRCGRQEEPLEPGVAVHRHRDHDHPPGRDRRRPSPRATGCGRAASRSPPRRRGEHDAGSTCRSEPRPTTARNGSGPRWPLYSAAWVAARNGSPEPTHGGTNQKNGMREQPGEQQQPHLGAGEVGVAEPQPQRVEADERPPLGPDQSGRDHAAGMPAACVRRAGGRSPTADAPISITSEVPRRK